MTKNNLKQQLKKLKTNPQRIDFINTVLDISEEEHLNLIYTTEGWTINNWLRYIDKFKIQFRDVDMINFYE